MAAVVAAGAVAVLGVVLAGPLEVGAPRWNPAPPVRTAQPRPTLTGQATSPPSLAGAEGAAGVIRIMLAIVFALAVALLVAVVVVVLVRRFQQRRRRVRRAAEAASESGAATVTDTAVAAPVVQRGIARALQILDEERTPDDAIVQAWLGLEDAARQAGARRAASETPAEYAARIIRRFETNSSATDILLRLYQDVRFGGRHADEGTVRTARECLLHLQRSWHDPADRPTASAPSPGGER